jgi:hypothetical protein
MQLAPRDLSLLGFLDRTPATASQLLKASVTFQGEAFRDERRVRERLQSLGRGKLVHAYPLAIAGGGLANYYKLTAEAYRVLHGPDAPLPHRSYFAALSPSRLLHTLGLADAIVHLHTAAEVARAKLTAFHRESEVVLEIGHHRVVPDCHVQFLSGGRYFNVLFEIDRSTEPIDSLASSSIRTKLLAYEAYQNHVLELWKRGGRRELRPYFRVAFLTMSVDRAHHILSLAADCARNGDRRLCYAATQDEFLAMPDALREPLFLDHAGYWRALVDMHPTARFLRAPVRFAPREQRPLPLLP